MKKIFLLFLLGMFIAGCGANAQRSEFWQHDTIYKNWDHTKYSWGGYKKSTDETLQKSEGQDWWGIPKPEEESP
jgi:hypothetical protein